MRRTALIALLALAAGGAAAAEAVPEEAAAAAQREALQRRAAVEQKLKLADQMLFRSAGARRVAASGNEEALRLLGEARASFSGARAALEAGNLAAADQQAAESLRRVGLAMRLVPDAGGEAQALRLRYARVLAAVQAFQASQFLSAGGAAGPRPPEMERVRELVGQAQALADKADFAEASRVIDRAADLILESAPRLVAARGAGAPGLAGLAAEDARFQSYEDLVAIASSRPGVTPERARGLAAALDRARALQIRAQDLAVGGRYDEAMTASQDSIAVLREALRAVGGVPLQ